MTTLAVLAGAGFAAALWVVVSGWSPQPEQLDRALARLGRPTTSNRADSGSDERDARLGARLRRIPLVERAVGLVETDLRVLGQNPDNQAAQMAAYVVVGLLWGPVVTAGAQMLLGLHLPFAIPLWAAVVGAAGAGWLSVRQVRQQAKEARAAFAHSLSAYCDVVTMTLSARRELHAALFDAAATGDGRAWRQIQDALQRGFLNGNTPAESLTALGNDLGVADLTELGALVALADDEGSNVVDSIATKAASLRERLVTDNEAQAASATERMAIPGAMVLIGFLCLLAYPALHVILEQGR